jgi:hypothetical protein
MSLDLNKVASQVDGMAANLKAGSEERRQHLLRAIAAAGDPAIDLEQLKQKIAASKGKTSWLVAGPVDGLNQHYPALPLPDEFSVIATDGSQIDVDRHHSARCYLINIGSVVLNYSSSPDASLDSSPRLYSEDQDLVMKPPSGIGREQPVEGALLGIKRSIEECRRLAQLATELPAAAPVLALVDGSLILWGLAGKDCPDFVVEELLDRGFIRCLDDIKKLNKDRTVAIASYISFPRSTDVINALRIALCPNDIADCEYHCNNIATGSRQCDAVAGVQDRGLFFSILAEDERSALFISQSSVVQKHYGSHRIYFFYVRAGDEIARVEIPEWAARDEKLLNLTHTLILDQCRRGQGYPVALSEAHEQAVVTGADRQNFQQLLEISLLEEGIQQTTSAKSRSKRTRWL